MKQVIEDKNLIAYCGLYCGACSRYLSEKCPGCQKNEKASWCKLRKCCIENGYKSCADCQKFSDVNGCKKFNNVFSKIFAVLFKSNRKGCIEKIRQIGYDNYAWEMAQNKMRTVKK
jgi:hypothetical protein